MQPLYLALSEQDFKNRIEKSRKMLSACSLCPRRCTADRRSGKYGFCRASGDAEVTHWQLHFGEEPPLSGDKGAGTVFFAHCNMRCVYCQNYQISQLSGNESAVSPEGLARMMLKLQEQGAQNIDLVSPTPYVPQIVAAVFLARGQGLKIPLVYNTNGYESEDTLALLEGIIDIYLPDLKYSAKGPADTFSGTKNYWEYACRALEEMYRQTGGFIMDENGRGARGLLVRHLVLPNDVSGSIKVLDFLAQKLGRDIGLSLMSQYAPCFQASRYAELNRKISAEEYGRAVKHAEDLDFEQCWIQQMESSQTYFPDFERKDVFAD